MAIDVRPSSFDMSYSCRLYSGNFPFAVKFTSLLHISLSQLASATSIGPILSKSCVFVTNQMEIRDGSSNPTFGDIPLRVINSRDWDCKLLF